MSKEKILLHMSVSRLFTNLHEGEHNSFETINRVKNHISELSTLFSRSMTEDLFVESLHKGGQASEYPFKLNRSVSYSISSKFISKKIIQLLFKFFKEPSSFLKDVSIGYDSEGILFIDLMSQFILSDTLFNKFFNSGGESSYKLRKNVLHSIYNVILAVKYTFIKKLFSLLSFSTGIDIEEVCEMPLMEIEARDKESKFDILNYSGNKETYESSQTSKVWEYSLARM